MAAIPLSDGADVGITAAMFLLYGLRCYRLEIDHGGKCSQLIHEGGGAWVQRPHARAKNSPHARAKNSAPLATSPFF